MSVADTVMRDFPKNPPTPRTMRIALAVLLAASALTAQTSPATPCPSSSILLTAKPIKGVGTTTIKNACPSFLAALASWYAAHPTATVSDAVAAIAGTPPVVVPPPVIVAPPVVPPSSHYTDDFSTYSSSAQLNSGDARKPGNFWFAPSGHDMAGMIPQGVSYDPLEKAMRYDWPSRSTNPCTGAGAEITIGAQPRWLPTVPVKELWIRFTSKESANFEHGRNGCGGRSYKYFLVVFEKPGVLGRAGAYLGDGPLATATSTRLYMDLNSPSNVSGVKGGFRIGGDTTWGGGYHTWVIGLEGIGTAAATFSVYLDGSLVNTIAASFLDGQTVGPGWAVTFEMGANINNGPDHAESRWFREFGVYTQRPRLK